MMNNIFSMLNQNYSIESMKCLALVTNEKRREEYLKEGYSFGYTADTWKAEYPDIDPKYVFCTKSIILPCELYYYDRDKYICFPMHIYNGCPITAGDDIEKYKDDLNQQIRTMQECYQKKEYAKLLMNMFSEESGNMSLSIVRDMLMNEEPNHKLYKAAIDTYSMSNCGADILGIAAVKRLIDCKSEKQKQKTLDALSGFGDTITIYRGEGSKSTPYQKAFSWSTDLNIACFFAGWRDSECNCTIYEAQVSKLDIIEYLTDRDEAEVLVLPEHVKNVKAHNCVCLDEFLTTLSNTGIDGDYTYPYKSYSNQILKDTKNIYAHIKTADHKLDHTLRVALLANYLYRVCVLEEHYVKGTKAAYQRAKKILEKLISAVEYHDAGRTDNSSNTEHGAAGYQVYLKTRVPDDVIEFLTEYHCKSDEEALAYWKEHFADRKDADDIWNAYLIIRDADALDRVRFSRSSVDYLDAKTLRFEKSLMLVPVAMQINKNKLY